MTKITKFESDDDRDILCRPTSPIQNSEHELRKLIPTIKQLITAHQEMCGVGLAATQIAKALPIFVIEISEQQALLRDNAQAFSRRIFINPSYEGIAQDGQSADIEGCISVDSIAGWVPRFNSILFNAIEYDIEHDTFIEIQNAQFNGFVARVLQHETDHTKGVLITDRLTENCEQGTPTDMYALRRQRLSDEKRQLLDDLIQKQAQTGIFKD